MDGNMIELKKPTLSIASIANLPLLRIESKTRTEVPSAKMHKSRPVLTRCKIAEPMKRPIIAPPQGLQPALNGVEGSSFGQHQDELGAKDVAGRQGTRLSNAAEFRPLVAGEGHFAVCRHTNLEA
jgi:hypothetical protein